MKSANVAIWIVMVAACGAAAWIIFCRHGTIPGLDFGCGQYYYTDIPGWQKYFSVEGIKDSVPLWIYYAAFFGWGYAAYRIWRFVDGKTDPQKGGEGRDYDPHR